MPTFSKVRIFERRKGRDAKEEIGGDEGRWGARNKTNTSGLRIFSNIGSCGSWMTTSVAFRVVPNLSELVVCLSCASSIPSSHSV
jgi:hypothetical protein